MSLDCVIDCNASISDKTREFITIELTLFSSAIHRHPRIIFAIIFHPFVRSFVRWWRSAIFFCGAVGMQRKLFESDKINCRCRSVVIFFHFYFVTLWTKNGWLSSTNSKMPRKKPINYFAQSFLVKQIHCPVFCPVVVLMPFVVSIAVKHLKVRAIK